MSDIRTKLLLGTTLSALAMIFVMAVGVDAFDTKTTTATQPVGLNGHLTVWVVHPDGSMSYSQGDNAISTSDQGIRQLIDGAFTSDPFNCMDIGSGAGNAGGINTALAGGTTAFCDQIANGVNDVAGKHTLVGTFTISQANVGGLGGSIDITEAELANDATTVISTVPITAVAVIEGSVLTLNYSLTLG